MEKLQAALQKARQSRKMGKEVAAPGSERLVSHGVDAHWDALTPFEVPRQHLKKYRVVADQAGAGSTPFDILRTKVLLQLKQNDWKRIAITSPMPNSGKTTMACNLALGLSRQKHLRTMLFDMDLRNPSVNEFFDIRPKYTSGDVLTGQVDFADQCMRFGHNLAVSAAHDPEPDPTRMLMSENASQIINEVESRYQPDVIIFDMPSVMVSDDTLSFLRNADCALIVIRANFTRFSQFDICEREVAQYTNAMGVVLNAYRYGAAGEADN